MPETSPESDRLWLRQATWHRTDGGVPECVYQRPFSGLRRNDDPWWHGCLYDRPGIVHTARGGNSDWAADRLGGGTTTIRMRDSTGLVFQRLCEDSCWS